MLSVQGLLLVALLFGGFGYAIGEYIGGRNATKRWEQVIRAYDNEVAKRLSKNTDKFKEVVQDYVDLKKRYDEVTQ